jgi:hypothetical protein
MGVHGGSELDKKPNPTDEDIKRALDPILCCCGKERWSFRPEYEEYSACSPGNVQS